MKPGESLWGHIEEIKKGEPAEKGNEPEKHAGNLEATYSKMNDIYKGIVQEIDKMVIGQNEVIEQVLVSVFTENHALLEGFPGLGKTLLVSTLADIMDMRFKRIQCTPDLMPSDITGTYIVEEREGKKVFKFEKGPVFTNILLADEINRATPKTQSALLEAMQERQVSIGTTTHQLDRPFFVLATQNPIEMEGTYPLPEAQLDRFLMKIVIGYPAREEEYRIVDRYTSEKKPETKKIMNRQDLLTIQELIRKMPISEENKNYAINLITHTRPQNNETAKQYLDYGASPRASIGLVLASKARALINGRNYVKKEDIQTMAYPVLRHRLILNFESERKGITTDDVIHRIMHGI